MTPRQRYIDLIHKLLDTRKRLGNDSAEEDILLSEMDIAWYALSPEEETKIEKLWDEGKLPRANGDSDD